MSGGIITETSFKFDEDELKMALRSWVRLQGGYIPDGEEGELKFSDETPLEVRLVFEEFTETEEVTDDDLNEIEIEFEKDMDEIDEVEVKEEKSHKCMGNGCCCDSSAPGTPVKVSEVS